MQTRLEMTRNTDEILTGWYAGEIGGGALFSRLATRAEPAIARKWRSLARVESAVAARLAAVLESRQIPVPKVANAGSRALQRSDAVAGKSWTETMHWLQSLAAAALREMQADAAALPEELAATGSMVVSHEEALLAFAQAELAGAGEHSLQPLEAFLDSVKAPYGRDERD